MHTEHNSDGLWHSYTVLLQATNTTHRYALNT